MFSSFGEVSIGDDYGNSMGERWGKDVYFVSVCTLIYIYIYTYTL